MALSPGVCIPLASVTPSTAATATDTTIGTTNNNYNSVLMQNNSATLINYDFDQAATANSLVLMPGDTIQFDTSSAVHIYQASGATMNINGSNGLAIRFFATGV